MLSEETSILVKHLLVKLACGELQIEAARSRICSIKDFALVTAFQRIDRHKQGRINSFDLVEYLKDHNSYNYCEYDLNKLASYFSSDQSGYLTFNE